MKKFIFRLETLLRMRRAREGALKRDLEYASQKWHQSEEQERMLQTQIEALMDEMQKKRSEGKFNLQETYSQILEHLTTSLHAAEQNRVFHLRGFEEQQERLKHAVQERKVIEKIKEKHYTHWRASEVQTEGALLDEISCHKPAHFE